MESVPFQPLSTTSKINEDIKTNDITNVISYIEHNSIKFPINPKNTEINGQLTLLEFIRMSEKMKLIPPNTLTLFLKSCEYEDRNQWFTSDEVCQLLGYRNDDLTKALKKEFLEDMDYKVSFRSAPERKNGEKFNPNPKKNYQISTNTVKELAIRKDKTVRQYYLTLEQLLKDHVKYQIIFNKWWNNKQLQLEKDEIKSQLQLKDLEKEEIKKELDKCKSDMEHLKKIGYIYYIMEIIPSEGISPDYRYIGKTTQPLTKRFNEHLSMALDSLKANFYRAVFRNGWKNFTIDHKLSHPVYYIEDKELDEIETKEISDYMLYNNNHVWNICKTSNKFKQKRSKSSNSIESSDNSSDLDISQFDIIIPQQIKNDRLPMIRERRVMPKKPFRCNICQHSTFSTSEKLTNHNFTIHSIIPSKI